MRVLLLIVHLSLASAHAQSRLELTDPLLLLDGQPLAVNGAPLIVPTFDTLELEIPRWGTLLVSDVPFDGARRAGDFDRSRLVLVVDGRSLRLRSRTSLLGASSPRPAYARLDASSMAPLEGPVYLRHRARVSPPAAPSPPARPSDPVVPPPSDAPDELARQLAALRYERDRLRAALAETEHERDDALLRLAILRDEVERLRASLDGLGTPPARTLDEEPAPVAPERISLPQFDLTRLTNPQEVLVRLETTPYPEWARDSRIGGDVLVLFRTDPSGAVVRTAVPRPLGGGLDALAEEIVQAMRFIPVRADGQLTGLRSQVVVRFIP